MEERRAGLRVRRGPKRSIMDGKPSGKHEFVAAVASVAVLLLAIPAHGWGSTQYKLVLGGYKATKLHPIGGQPVAE